MSPNGSPYQIGAANGAGLARTDLLDFHINRDGDGSQPAVLSHLKKQRAPPAVKTTRLTADMSPNGMPYCPNSETSTRFDSEPEFRLTRYVFLAQYFKQISC